MISALLLSGALVGLPCQPAPARGHPPEGISTADQIRADLQHQNSLREWWVEYDSRARNEDSDFLVRRTFAVSETGQIVHWIRTQTSAHSFSDDPLQVKTVVRAGEMIVQWPSSRSFSISPARADAELPGTMPNNFVFTSAGWWPFEDRPRPRAWNGTPLVIPDILTDTTWTVGSETEMRGGRRCYVLEFPNARVWLDAERGCAIVARELYDAGRLIRATECFDHFEVSPGVWLARRFSDLAFDPRTGKRAVDTEVAVVDAGAGGFKHSDFEFVPGPGWLRMDMQTGRYEQVAPGGLEHVESTVQLLARITEPPQGRPRQVNPLLIAGNALGVMVVVIAVCLRRIGRRPV